MSRKAKILYGAAFFLVIVFGCGQIFAGYAGDKVWMLLHARMMLEGKQLYVDIFEVNMPFIVWIDTIPVAVTTHLAWLKDYQWLGLMGVLCVMFSVWVCSRLIRDHPGFSGNKNQQIQFALLLCYAFIVCTNPAYFFDRDHIFLILTFPYLLSYMPSLARCDRPCWLRICVGLLAGVGFSIKPHTLILLLSIQLLYILRERRAGILWSLENILIYLLGLFYLFCVWHFTPNYLNIVLPMALLTYGATSTKINGLYYSSIALLMLGVTFADFRPRHRSPLRKDIYYFLALCISFYLYALANNGWSYSYNVLNTFILFLSGWVLWEFLYLRKRQLSDGVAEQSKEFIFGARACALNLIANGLVIALFWSAVFTTDCADSLVCKTNNKFAEMMQQEHFQSFGTISISFSLWTHLVNNYGVRWDTRFEQIWMLPKFFASDDAFAREHHWILDYVAQGYAQDLNERKPEVMFVDDADIFYSVHKHIDLIAYLEAFPNFKNAWQHYHMIRTLDLCYEGKRQPGGKVGVGCRYFMYRRTP